VLNKGILFVPFLFAFDGSETSDRELIVLPVAEFSLHLGVDFDYDRNTI